MPGAKVFIVGRAMWGLEDITRYGRVGESNTADGSLTKEVIILSPSPTTNGWQSGDIIGIFSAGKWVTGESSGTTNSNELVAGTTLYGIEIDA